MKTHRLPLKWRSQPRAFTLIELLVVIAIIAILAALTMGTFSFAQQSAARNRTTAGLAAIRSALELYKEKFGEYPEPVTPDEKLGSDTSSSLKFGGAHMLYQAITGDGNSALKLASGGGMESDGNISDDERPNSINGNLPPAMIFPPTSITKPGTATPRWLIDGFGHPYQYVKGGGADAVNTTYDLWSFAQLDSTKAGAGYSLTVKKDDKATAVWIKNW